MKGMALFGIVLALVLGVGVASVPAPPPDGLGRGQSSVSEELKGLVVIPDAEAVEIEPAKAIAYDVSFIDDRSSLAVALGATARAKFKLGAGSGSARAS